MYITKEDINKLKSLLAKFWRKGVRRPDERDVHDPVEKKRKNLRNQPINNLKHEKQHENKKNRATVQYKLARFQELREIRRTAEEKIWHHCT